MVWDKTKPQGSTKIRNLGVVITPNWEAIETADSTLLLQAINLADRDALGIASDPTAIADSVITFCKKDASGKPQGYAIDPDSLITKLTGGSLTAANPGKVVFPNGLIIIWGTGAANTAWAEKTFALTGFTNNCFNITGSANGSTNTVGFDLVSKTKYKVKASSASAYHYFAIGN